MFLTVAQFVDVWKQEMQRTHDVFAGLTDASLSQSAEAGGRTLARLAWHLTQTVPEMLHKTGLDVKGPAETEPPPASAATIVNQYDTAAQSALEEIQRNWRDEDLTDLDEMYGREMEERRNAHGTRASSGSPSWPDDGVDATGRSSRSVVLRPR